MAKVCRKLAEDYPEGHFRLDPALLSYTIDYGSDLELSTLLDSF